MKTYRMIGLGLAAGLALATASANAQIKNAPAGTMARADQNFMDQAIEGDLSEINMGKLAQQKGQSQGTKQFGQMLEQDHSQNLQKAKQIADRLGLIAPSEPNTKQKSMYDRLSELSGAQFDGQFAQDMVADHKEDIGTFEKEAKSKGELADFAQQTIPTLQKHLQTAQSLAASKQ
jgi:putative membrane protein